ncbi:MAG: hypothetical protein AAGE01_17370 [Pseudomonadota bacterium]
MPVDLSDLEDAFQCASYGEGPLDTLAVVRRSTGEIFVRTDGGVDDGFPADYRDDISDYVEIPGRHDLALGTGLVFRFVDRHVPELRKQVERYFCGPGAYAKFKDLLERHRVLEQWYDFEQVETLIALRDWCDEVGLEIGSKTS